MLQHVCQSLCPPGLLTQVAESPNLVFVFPLARITSNSKVETKGHGRLALKISDKNSL